MNALVTTSRSLILLDIQTGKYETLDSSKGVYYGIAVSDNKFYVAARHNNQRTTQEEREKESGRIIVFDFEKRYIGTIQPTIPLRDIHQIWYYDGMLWVVCSFDNKIVIYDGVRWHEWFPEPTVSNDYNHFNSLFFQHNQVYVVAHNWERKSEIWTFSYPQRRKVDWSLRKEYVSSFLGFLDRWTEKFELLGKVEFGNQAHNFWIQDSCKFVCSSLDGKIINQSGFEYCSGKYPRGIAVTEKLILLGLSEISSRDKRHLGSSSIRVLNDNWNFLHEIKMPGEGLILDIKVPGYFDACHPHINGQRLCLAEQASEDKINQFQISESMEKIATVL